MTKHPTGHESRPLRRSQRMLARLTPQELETIIDFLDGMTDVDRRYMGASPPKRRSEADR